MLHVKDLLSVRQQLQQLQRFNTMVQLKVHPVVKMSRLSTTGCQDVSSFNSEPISVPGTNPKLIGQCLNITLFEHMTAKRETYTEVRFIGCS